MERKKTLTMDWKGAEDDDDDEHFFESFEMAGGGASSSDEDEEFQESRMSFSANSQRFRIMTRKTSTAAVAVAIPDFDYNIWMAAPGSITERRKRLLYGMGLDENKKSLRLASIAIGRAMTKKFENNAPPESDSSDSPKETTVADSAADTTLVAADARAAAAAACESTVSAPPDEHKMEHSPVPFVLVRSRSEGDADCDQYSLPKMRKEELIGMTPELVGFVVVG